jgi:WD40 repeat protein
LKVLNWMPRRGVALLCLTGLGVLVALMASRDGDESPVEAAAQRAAVIAPFHLADRPRQAALAALASQRLDPSLESEMAMLAVAGAQRGVQRVISTGSPAVEAAVRVRNLVVTAGSNRLLRVWRATDGELLGEAATPRPLVALAESTATSLVGGSDEGGHVTLFDLSNPREPSARPLRSTVDTDGGLLALAFSAEGVDLLGLSAAGVLSRIDVTRDTTARIPLGEIAAPLSFHGDLAAAELETEEEETLLVVSRDGAVARIELDTSRSAAVAAPGLLPGRATSLSGTSYPEKVLVGATGGTLVAGEEYEEPFSQPGTRISDLAFDGEGEAWIGKAEGIVRQDESGVATQRPVPAGGEVEQLVKSSGGLVAIHPGGVVSLLERESGLSFADSESTPVASFGPDGELLVADGYDANHIEMLKTLQPGHATIDGELVENPDLRHYRPDPSWWPYAEDEEALYVNDALMDDRFVVAGGQDPTGEAVVLVWDADTGEPLQRLVLGTGGVDPAEPSIVSTVLLIPGRDLLAAYSAVQELVTFWSTETWEQVDAVPVGPVGDLSLSADGSTIVAAGTSEEEREFEGEGEHESTLVFIDADGAEVIDEVATGDTYRVAYAPDGDRLATIGYDGTLRIRSSDGHRALGAPIRLDGQPTALAWRPDGKAIAVALEGGEIVLAPAEGNGTPARLPTDPNTGSFDLSWSRDGSLLASTTSGYDDDGGEGYDPGPARIWTLSPARLERRMCQLAGGPAGEAEWQSLVDEDLPPLHLCRTRGRHEPPAPADGSDRGPAVLAFQSGERLFAADARGQTAMIALLPKEAIPPTFAWAGGNLGWVAAGKAQILVAGARNPEWWPCPCSGAAWRDGALITVAADGRGLLEFRPRRKRPRWIEAERSLDGSRLLGAIGNWAIVGRNSVAATFMELDMVDREGAVQHLLDDARGNVEQLASSPQANRIAYSASWVAGPCSSPPSIGILTKGPRGGVEISFPPLPGEEEEIRKVHSVQVLPEGIGAAIGSLGCFDGPGGGPADPPPPASRYELRGARWIRTGERGGDIQLADGQVAMLSSGGELTLRGGDEEVVVASDVDVLAARP